MIVELILRCDSSNFLFCRQSIYFINENGAYEIQMRLFPCAMLFMCQVNIFRGDRETRCFWKIVRCRETDRVREVGNYVHSWRPLYGFGVRLFLRLWYRCLWHVDRGSAARFVYRTMLCFLRRHNAFGRVYVFTPTTCRAWSVFQFHSRRIYERV